jgi:hypothetical protein
MNAESQEDYYVPRETASPEAVCGPRAVVAEGGPEVTDLLLDGATPALTRASTRSCLGTVVDPATAE